MTRKSFPLVFSFMLLLLATTNPPPPGTLLDTRQFGTGKNDAAYALATNAASIYVAGYVGGALPGQTHEGGEDAFWRKYSP
ncbi:hypothetical protein [Meiothermus hypogaeus]|uniref:Uncharacterized protein n=2 Tax=Meiothermus hypogaeus TaxID=884155 RepID=A0A511QXH7_9DEIN|nr:hypothetical protein [Meiothermus hypogaeus]RIH80686.1 hypothetical protein Mhypo_00402 [Meiothermus hypogaeus]GEM82083.1 hypothetical protein MHY01S_02490 [Meiothermus hypogaeus NBRC 106114]GIW36395.1 MAG: hypothetical protein KatS3mg073_0540 [Meiothermus sp.]